MKKKPIVDKLLGTTHLEADIALLRAKNPQHTLLQHPHFNALQADTDALMALLDMTTEEEIVLNRRQLVADSERNSVETVAATDAVTTVEVVETVTTDAVTTDAATYTEVVEAVTTDAATSTEVVEAATTEEVADESKAAGKPVGKAKAAPQKKSSKKKKSTPK